MAYSFHAFVGRYFVGRAREGDEAFMNWLVGISSAEHVRGMKLSCIRYFNVVRLPLSAQGKLQIYELYSGYKAKFL